ncbi:MAG TPA: tetratricopeptide repeat protein [Acidimicrobiales bacterium]|nr:tetratricopeptide repeat protein [Acidimicrobiales bacterium]
MDDDFDISALWDRVTRTDGVDRADALIQLGGALLMSGDGVEALAAVDAATDLFLSASDVPGHPGLAAAHHNAAVVLQHLGRTADAAARHERAVDVHLAGFRTTEAARCLHHTGDLFVLAGDHRAALDRFDRAAALFGADDGDVVDDARELGTTLLAAASAAFDAGRPGWARDRLGRATAALRSATEVDVGRLGRCEVLRARLLRRRRQWSAALAAVQCAMQLYDAVGDEVAIAEAFVLRVELLADAGLDEDAVKVAEVLRSELRDLDDPEGVARCDLAAGRALLRLGDQARAVHALEAAATVFDALGRPGEADAARRLVAMS